MSSFWRKEVTPEWLQIDGQRLPLVIRRHRRAKRICLRYNPTQHAISLTLPRHTRVSDGLRFLTQKSEWLIETLREIPTQKQIKPGVVIPLLGERVRIRHEEAIHGDWMLLKDSLLVSGERDEFPLTVNRALRKMATHRLQRDRPAPGAPHRATRQPRPRCATRAAAGARARAAATSPSAGA